MAKSTIRKVVDQALKELNLVHDRVFTNTSTCGVRVKYQDQRSTSLSVMHFILTRTGMDPELGQYKYRYATLTSPKHGDYHGLAIGCTDDKSVLMRACVSGPTLYTDSGMYYNQSHGALTLGDMTERTFSWRTLPDEDAGELNTPEVAAKRHEQFKKDAAVCAERRERLKREAREDEANKAEQELKDKLFEAYKAAKTKRTDMVYARNQAYHVFSADVSYQMELELNELTDVWNKIGFPLV